MTQRRNALLSVYHKDGITEFAKELTDLGFNIYASGGTARHLAAAGIAVTDVATLVGGQAILGHRVVTLSREVHAGLLARSIETDASELARLHIPRIDLVCVDLYPLEAEIAKPGATLESVIDQTDIGGPTMLRSGAKGQRIVICDPSDRQLIIEWLKSGESDKEAFIERLCAKAEFVVSTYCTASANYRSGGEYVGIFGKKILPCKYGENGWQTPAALFSSGTSDPLALDQFRVVEGTEPSYNNLCDVDRLLQTVTHIAAGFEKNSIKVPFIAVGVKHGNACGAAIGSDSADVLQKMMAGDKEAIFGGLIMTNFLIGSVGAEDLAGKMLDGVIAPGLTPEAIELLRRKGNKCRFIVNPALESLGLKSLDTAKRFRYVRGGMLLQPNYTFVPSIAQDTVRTGPDMSEGGWNDLLLAWGIGSTSNSNTITLVKNGKLIGNGVGQQSRVVAARVAVMRADLAGHEVYGSVAYSDSFFPFPDGPKKLIEAGVKAILTSSGSIRDKETIDLCKSKDVTLYMVADKVGRGFFGH